MLPLRQIIFLDGNSAAPHGMGMTLSEWMKTTGTTCRTLAQTLSVHHTLVWRWARGERMPSIEQAHNIEKVTHDAVPIASWLRK
jgi:hypothetical protein